MQDVNRTTQTSAHDSSKINNLHLRTIILKHYKPSEVRKAVKVVRKMTIPLGYFLLGISNQRLDFLLKHSIISTEDLFINYDGNFQYVQDFKDQLIPCLKK